MFGKLKQKSEINTSGIGLGLFICKRICETFDGKIALESSKLNAGSVFSFDFKTKGSFDSNDPNVSKQILSQFLEESKIQDDQLLNDDSSFRDFNMSLSPNNNSLSIS